MRVGRIAGFIIAADPVQELVAGLALRHLDGVVHAGDPDAFIHQFLDDLQMVFLDDRVAAAAVHEEDDRAGTVKDRLVLGPSPGERTLARRLALHPGTSPAACSPR